MPSLSALFFLGAIVVTSLLCTVQAAGPYQLVDHYEGFNFFKKFRFFTDSDPTNGFVQYVNSSYAAKSGLIRAYKDHVYVGVDHTNHFPATGPGRPSVRLESLQTYNHGLFILNLTHFPYGCGAWPAFWTLGPNWPYTGEIDVAEGVNLNQYNLMSLHSGPNCTIAGADETGTLITANCDSSGPDKTGCGVQDKHKSSYGAGFNAAGGGLYVMEWTSKYIRIWTFRPDKVPISIKKGKPKPTEFGTPDANMQGSCKINENFLDHYIVFDITFCGDFAGAVYNTSTCPRAKLGRTGCNEYVGRNPSDFKNVHWDINNLRVYQTKGSPKVAVAAATLSSVTPLAKATPAVAATLDPPAMGDSTTAAPMSSSLPVPTQTGQAGN